MARRKEKKAAPPPPRADSLYMNCLPDGMADTADWVLVLKNGVELPCHSQILSAHSPVLLGLSETKPREDGKIAIPFSRDLDVADGFLRWIYRIKPTLTPLLAEELAYLGDEWNISGRTGRLVLTASNASQVFQCSDLQGSQIPLVQYLLKP